MDLEAAVTGARASVLWKTLAILGLAAAEAGALAKPAPPPSSRRPAAADAVLAAVAEASRRFGMPTRWIDEVIRAESGHNPLAVSRAGAMGLMQIMPGTYAELRRRYRLGADPFAARDNILAGTAYLRELHDRYGPRGMLAAYNAGPRRWEQHIGAGRPLPQETTAYLARLAPRIGLSPAPLPSGDAVAAAMAPNSAPIFVDFAATTRPDSSSRAVDSDAEDRSSDLLFAIGSVSRRRRAPPTDRVAAGTISAGGSAAAIDPERGATLRASPEASALFVERRRGRQTER